MEIYEILNWIITITNVITVIRMLISAVMCVIGYKWKKGLIGTVALYWGVYIGAIFAILLSEINLGIISILPVFIVPILLSIMAYRIAVVNHFFACFLVVLKLVFMIGILLIEQGTLDLGSWIIAAPFILAILGGIIFCTKLNYYALIFCFAYIGATELVPKVIDFFNKSLFLATGDISTIFDPQAFLLNLVGVELPDMMTTIGIIVVMIISFIIQSFIAKTENIDLSKQVLDDTNYKEK